MRFALVIIINAAIACAAWARDASPQELVLQANEHLRSGQYDEAIEKYERAAELLPDAAEIAYNQAIGHYRKGDFEKAAEQFITSLKTRDPELEAKAKFNLGNCAYAAALAKKDHIPEAVEYLKSAILHYKDAIESNPQDKDARINIEMAQLLMKDLLDKQKQQQQEEQQDQNQEDDEEQDQQEQDENQDQQQDQEGEEQQQDQSSEEQDEQQPGDQKQQQEGGGEQQKSEQQQGQQQQNENQQGRQQAGEDQKQEQQQGQKGQEQKMTREEAKRLLQMIRDKEMRRRHELARRTRVKLAPVNKDW